MDLNSLAQRLTGARIDAFEISGTNGAWRVRSRRIGDLDWQIEFGATLEVAVDRLFTRLLDRYLDERGQREEIERFRLSLEAGRKEDRSCG